MENENDPFAQAYLRDHPVRQVAVLLLINREYQVFLVRTKGLPNHWQPLGGGIDAEDASPEDAVLREVWEEARLDLSREDLVHLCDVPYDFGDGVIYSFAARLGDAAPIIIDHAEIEEARWFALREAALLQMFPATSRILQATALLLASWTRSET